MKNGLNLIMGLYAPQGLPGDVKDTLVNAVAKATKDPSFVAKVEATGLFSSYENPAAMRRRLQAEYADILGLSEKLKH